MKMRKMFEQLQIRAQNGVMKSWKRICTGGIALAVMSVTNTFGQIPVKAPVEAVLIVPVATEFPPINPNDLPPIVQQPLQLGPGPQLIPSQDKPISLETEPVQRIDNPFYKDISVTPEISIPGLQSSVQSLESVAPVPEPSSIALIIVGVVLFAAKYKFKATRPDSQHST
jgi:hypothetical protein